jgi:hypothetical protein
MKTIEQIAKLLLKHKIPFYYDNNRLSVNDAVVKYELFRTAEYHSDKGHLVLMDNDYDAVDMQRVINYFQVKAYKK